MEKQTTEYLMSVHYKIRELFESGDRAGLENYLKSFCTEEATAGELRIALVICKDIKKISDFIPEDTFEEMKRLLFSKTNSKY
jgi:hypothetical protein